MLDDSQKETLSSLLSAELGKEIYVTDVAMAEGKTAEVFKRHIEVTLSDNRKFGIKSARKTEWNKLEFLSVRAAQILDLPGSGQCALIEEFPNFPQLQNMSGECATVTEWVLGADPFDKEDTRIDKDMKPKAAYQLGQWC